MRFIFFKYLYFNSLILYKNKTFFIKNSKYKNVFQLKLNEEFCNVIVGDFINLKIIVHYRFLLTFLSILKQGLRGLNFGWYTKLQLCSRNFSAYKVKNVKIPYFLLNLGYGHKLKVNIPIGLEVYCRKKIILLSGYDRVQLYNFADNIYRLKPLNAYKARGIKFFEDKLVLKPGKQSQFK